MRETWHCQIEVARTPAEYRSGNLNANQVFRWRRLFREPAGDVGVGRFVPIVVEAARGPAK